MLNAVCYHIVMACDANFNFAPGCSIPQLDSIIGNVAHIRLWLQEFTLNTQLDLERQIAATHSRALVAEEQLQSLQHYISQSTLAYQKEIMRLRSLLSGQYQAAREALADTAGSEDTRNALHRSGSAGDALRSSGSGSNERPELRPIRSATNHQGRLPRPMNRRPAVDAWHVP